MPLYRYACEKIQEDSNQIIHSATHFHYNDINAIPIFSYRYYTPSPENEKTENVYIPSLGYERRSSNGKRANLLPYNRYVFHYFINGQGRYHNVPIKTGQFLFIPPFSDRNFESDPQSPLEFYYITVKGPDCEKILHNAGFNLSEQISECPFISKIPSIFRAPLFESHHDSEPTMYLMSIFLQLMALHKNYNSFFTDMPMKSSFIYYKKAMIYIEHFLLQGVTPNDISHFLNISPEYLRKIFAKHHTCSLREYICKKRIEFAAEKLIYTQYTIREVANTIGYDDYTQFSRIFKKYMGVSPSEYKKKHFATQIFDEK